MFIYNYYDYKTSHTLRIIFDYTNSRIQPWFKYYLDKNKILLLLFCAIIPLYFLHPLLHPPLISSGQLNPKDMKIKLIFAKVWERVLRTALLYLVLLQYKRGDGYSSRRAHHIKREHRRYSQVRRVFIWRSIAAVSRSPSHKEVIIK